MRKRELVARLLSAAVAGVFLVAALGKLRPGGDTIVDAWLPPGSIGRFALVATEIATALWLLIGLLPRVAIVWTIVLLLGFSAVLAKELRKPTPRDCGCAAQLFPGVSNDPRANLRRAILRNGVCVLALTTAAALGPRRR
jgi:hypothetical protein